MKAQSIIFNDQALCTIGNAELLDGTLTGLLCSRKCPADKIIEAHERFKQWAADPGMTVVSGFHSPVEQECLRLLLKGQAKIIVCPAREIEHFRIPAAWRPALEAGRMLVLSMFHARRASSQTINRRNEIVAELADELFIPYAQPGGHLSFLV